MLEVTRNTHTDFYPRSPCGERLPINVMSVSAVQISIHALLAESDTWQRGSRITYVDFYPRSPCGERRFNPLKTFIVLTFLSTLSLRRATPSSTRKFTNIIISIHALLAESDKHS